MTKDPFISYLDYYLTSRVQSQIISDPAIRVFFVINFSYYRLSRFVISIVLLFPSSCASSTLMRQLLIPLSLFLSLSPISSTASTTMTTLHSVTLSHFHWLRNQTHAYTSIMPADRTLCNGFLSLAVHNGHIRKFFKLFNGVGPRPTLKRM